MTKSMRWVIPVTLLMFATISSVIAEYGDGISQLALADTEAAVVEESPAGQPAAPATAAAPAAGLAGVPGTSSAAPVPIEPQAAPAALPPVAPPPTAPPGGLPLPAAIVPANAPAAEPAATPGPRSRTKSSGKKPSANQYDTGSPGKARTGPAVVMVLPMQNNSALNVQLMLETLLDPEESDAVRTTVDSQSNSLIVRGTVEDIEKIRMVVEQLDRQQSGRLNGYGAVPPPQAPVIPYITSPQGAHWPLPYRVYSEAERKLQQEFGKLDNQSVELAKQYRHNAQTLGSEHPEQKRRRDDIAAAVAKAFDMRQEIQAQELKQLKDRLVKVEQSVGKRSKNRDEIIAKRVRELLEDDRDLEWNAANQANGTIYYQPPAVAYPSAVTPAKPLYRSQAAPVLPPDQPSSQTVKLPSPNTYRVQELASEYLLEAAKQSGQAASAFNQRSNEPLSQILGLSASDPNQPAGADQRQALEAAQERVVRAESKVAGLKRQLGGSVEEDPTYQRAMRDLESAKRQFNHAKSEADTVLKLLTLDLELAKAQLDGAKDELDAAKSQPDQKEDTRVKLSTAVRQAQLRVERALKTLLEHHSTMMKSTETSTDKDSEQAVPGTTPGRR